MLYNKNEFKSLKAVYKALDNCMEIRRKKLQ